MTPQQATVLMFCLYPLTILASLYLGGGLRQALAGVVLGYASNELRLADISWVTRNLVNACGFVCFASGALEVATQRPVVLSSVLHDNLNGIEREGEGDDADRKMVLWLALIAGAVFTTVQSQDMADQAGDRERGRWTMPLSLGDGVARWVTAVFVLVWSVVCVDFWGVGLGPRVVLGLLGAVVAVRGLVWRTVEADDGTFRVWNVWMGGMYLLPLAKALGI
jgi:4-hydroxybenzoate polyprenyltransferase